MARGFSIIVAADAEGGIGVGGQLPWHLPGDMKHFVRLTTGEGNNAVIMGRTTWQSIPPRFRPLRRRHNIVMTTNPNFELPPEVDRAASFEAALSKAGQADAIWVIGGAMVYRQALDHPGCHAVYLTRVQASFGCDVFFDGPGPRFVLAERGDERQDGGVMFRFERWVQGGG